MPDKDKPRITDTKSWWDTPQQAPAASVPKKQPASRASSVPPSAIACYGLAVIFAVIGFFVAYKDPSLFDKLVGGDAYNFIIYAGRGMIWMGAAIVLAVVGLGIQLAGHAAHLHRMLLRTQAQPAPTPTS